jgi:transcriptional regulator with XRE-family HTH domain
MPKPVPGKPGWVEGSADELLGLEPWESELIELRLALADAVRERRSQRGLTQKDLAALVGSTQPRVARLEQAEASLDAIVRAVMALGANRAEVARIVARRMLRSRRPADQQVPVALLAAEAKRRAGGRARSA